MKKPVALLVMLLLLGLFVPGAAALNVVTTMPNLWNVADEIGGDAVTVMYVAPPAAVHISSDTIDALLQQNSEFIKTADVFLGQ
ncbi:MAG TPA: zinc ABC transporter substrate-binding protein, partial [Methanocorpusculum sp.]|nr:zinc ABC transporter substrate-binding protein [Methanocorpusculum sp.]